MHLFVMHTDSVLIVGADKEIDVIDVSRQCDLKMRLGDFVEYYNSPNRDRVLNVISLEFSETRYTERYLLCWPVCFVYLLCWS